MLQSLVDKVVIPSTWNSFNVPGIREQERTDDSLVDCYSSWIPDRGKHIHRLRAKR